MLKLKSYDLRKIEKPARYVGGEYGQVLKNKENVLCRVLLASTDIYEYAMRKYELRKLYSYINLRKDTWCERVFFVKNDYIKLMTQKGIGLYALESKDSIKDFDVIFFKINNILDSFKLLKMLELGNIPIIAKDRGNEYPLVVVDASNLSSASALDIFADVILTKDLKYMYNNIIDAYILNKVKNNTSNINDTKKQVINSIQNIDINKDNQTSPLDRYENINILDSNIYLSEDCIDLELFSNGLYTKRQVQDVIKELSAYIDYTGKNVISFLPIDSTKYLNYELFKLELLNLIDKKGVKLSTKTINYNDIDLDFFKRTKIAKNTKVQFNIYALTDNLRKKYYSEMSESDIFNIISFLYANNVRHLELLTYIGFNDEKKEDLDNVIYLIDKIKRICRDENRYDTSDIDIIVRVNVYDYDVLNCANTDINNNISKIQEKIEYIKELLKKKGIRCRVQNIKEIVAVKLLNDLGKEAGNEIINIYNEFNKSNEYTKISYYDILTKYIVSNNINLRGM